MNRDTRFLLVIVITWFGCALAFGLTGVFANASAQTVVVTAWTLTGLVLLAGWKLPPVNRFARQADLSWLIVLHLTRFVGIYFLFLCRHGTLSCAFAKPAGIGDFVIAVGAALLLGAGASKRGWRTTIFVWNALGLLDIVLVVFTAFRVGVSDWAGMAPLRTLPLSLLPMFLVPLVIASHILIFVRLRTR